MSVRGGADQPGRAAAATLVVVVAVALLVVVVRGGGAAGPRADGSHPGQQGQVSGAAAPPDAATRVSRAVARDSVTQDGIQVDYAAHPVSDDADAPVVTQGGYADLVFAMRHATTGAPLIHGQPIVWVDSDKTASPGGGRLSCDEKMRLYAQGTFGFQPEVDLNAYYILTLNGDASISVIDPLGGVQGISQLYAMIDLASPGADWVMDSASSRIYVTMPEAGQVAVVDSTTFEVIANVDVDGSPIRAALEPGGHRLWVTTDASGEQPDGVTILDIHSLEVVASVATGAGEHDITFPSRNDGGAPGHGHGPDASVWSPGPAFVTNRDSGTVSLVDVQTLEKTGDIEVGRSPVSIDYDEVTGSVIVAAQDGTITAIDSTSADVRATMASSPGLISLRIAPGGRWAFAVNELLDTVEVWDTVRNRLRYSVPTAAEPDKVAFSAGSAYVRARGSAKVTVVDLSRLGAAKELPAVSVIAGQNPPGQVRATSVADPVVPHHGNEVLIVNPADNYIYDYMAGMNSPMGGFKNYAPAAQAVGIVDQGLRETAPGVFRARIRVSRAARYQVAFLLDEPRVVHCFDFTAVPRGD